MTPLTLISRALVAGGLSGARPALMLLLVVGSIALFSSAEALPDGFQWLIHEYAIIAIAALVIVEHFARTDPDIEEILEIPNAAIAASVAALLPALLPALDVPIENLESPAPQSVSSMETVNASLIDEKGFHIVVAIVTSLVLFWVKRRVVSAVGAMSLSQRYYRWAETGVIVGTMTVLVFAPALVVLLAVLIVVGGAALGTTVWFTQRRLDRLSRRACPSCGSQVRKEALLCFSCKTALDPLQRLE